MGNNGVDWMGDSLGNGLQRHLGEGLGMRNDWNRIIDGVINRATRALIQRKLVKADQLFSLLVDVLTKRAWAETIERLRFIVS